MVGFADEVLTSSRFRIRVMITGVLAVAAYLSCLGYAYRAIFADQSGQKRSDQGSGRDIHRRGARCRSNADIRGLGQARFRHGG